MPPRPILKKVRLLPYTSDYSGGALGTNEIIYASGKFVIGAPGNRNYALNHTDFHAVQTFTSNGTWVKPSQGSLAFVVIAGGGGGGTCGTIGLGGCGGGAGGLTAFIIPLSALPSTVPITVGAAGTRTTIYDVSGSSAGSGGNSSFESYVALGGQGAPPAGGVSPATSGVNATSAARPVGGLNSFTTPGNGASNTMLSAIGIPWSQGISASSSGGNGGSGDIIPTDGTNGTAGRVVILTI